MTLQNRVRPTGEIERDPFRGGLMGNRGILHGESRDLGRARWRHPNWVACVLSFRGRHRAIMTPGHYTELFFHDEAVALAAGHRPCAECRRPAYRDFRRMWEAALGPVGSARELDRILHAARVTPRTRQQRRHDADANDLPDGTFVLTDGRPHRLQGARAHPWHPGGYGASVPRPSGRIVVLTPEPTVAVLAAGYRLDSPD